MQFMITEYLYLKPFSVNFVLKGRFIVTFSDWYFQTISGGIDRRVRGIIKERHLKMDVFF